jgi:hypothetical protein
MCRVFETLANAAEDIFGFVGDGVISATDGGRQE